MQTIPAIIENRIAPPIALFIVAPISAIIIAITETMIMNFFMRNSPPQIPIYLLHIYPIRKSDKLFSFSYIIQYSCISFNALPPSGLGQYRTVKKSTPCRRLDFPPHFRYTVLVKFFCVDFSGLLQTSSFRHPAVFGCVAFSIPRQNFNQFRGYCI